MSVSEKSIARINKASVKDAKPTPKVVENTAPSKEVTTGVIANAETLIKACQKSSEEDMPYYLL